MRRRVVEHLDAGEVFGSIHVLGKCELEGRVGVNTDNLESAIMVSGLCQCGDGVNERIPERLVDNRIVVDIMGRLEQLDR